MAVTRVSTAATLFVVVARATVELSPPHLRGSDMGVPLRLLLVEDSENDALLLVRELTRAGFEPKDTLKRLVPVIERELREAAGRRERRRAEAALREAEAGYSTLVEQAPVGIYRSNPAGRFLSANRALACILGYDSPAELLGLDMTRDVYADPAERQRLLDRDSYTERE